MPFYRSVGQVPHKRHTQFRCPDGNLYKEEAMTTDGFASDASLLYHINSPSDVRAATVWDVDEKISPNRPLMPRLVQTHKLDAGGDAVIGRRLLAVNDDLRVSYVAADTASPLYRNAIGDEMYFVESGSARFESVFGVLEAGPDDFVIMPTSAIHRVVPTGDEPLRLLIAESTGTIQAPPRYLSAHGQFLNAPYCERDLRAPTDPYLVEDENVEVLVRHRNGGTRYTYAKHPFDVIGWDGYLYPYAFNASDFEPISGSIHQAPTSFQAFEAPGFVICALVPHKVESHPEAMIAPCYHANVDCDELLYFPKGSSLRQGTGIIEGSITWHPAGFTHGPRAGEIDLAAAIYNSGQMVMKNVHGVMIDTFRPLDVGEATLACEEPNYLEAWHEV